MLTRRASIVGASASIAQHQVRISPSVFNDVADLER